MKKILAVVFIALMLMSMGLVGAYATEGAEAPAGNNSPPIVAEAPQPVPTATPSPYNWAALATVAGCAAATLLVVQFTKSMIPDAIPTRLYVYFIALLIMMAATYIVNDGLAPGDVMLVVVNSFVAATSALGTYDLTFAGMDAKAKVDGK